MLLLDPPLQPFLPAGAGMQGPGCPAPALSCPYPTFAILRDALEGWENPVSSLSSSFFLPQGLLPCCNGGGRPWGKVTGAKLMKEGARPGQGGLTMPMNSISTRRSCSKRFLCR